MWGCLYGSGRRKGEEEGKVNEERTRVYVLQEERGKEKEGRRDRERGQGE